MQPEHVAERLRPPENLLATRGSHLVSRQLHDRTLAVTDQLVSGVEVRIVRRNAHLRADTKGVDRGATAHEVVDRELVKTSADEDSHVAQIGLVEQSP